MRASVVCQWVKPASISCEHWCELQLLHYWYSSLLMCPWKRERRPKDWAPIPIWWPKWSIRPPAFQLGPILATVATGIWIRGRQISLSLSIPLSLSLVLFLFPSLHFPINEYYFKKTKTQIINIGTEKKSL